MTIKARNELALSIIGDHFGIPTKRVCSAILQHGASAVNDIMNYSGLPFDITRNCLLALIQHNLIAFDFDPSSASRSTMYTVNVENVLRRVRFPNYLDVVERRVGLIPRLLLFELMKNGRMRVDDCLNAVEAQIDALLEQDPQMDFGGGDTSREGLREAFVELIMLRGARRVHKVNSSEAYHAAAALQQKQQEERQRRSKAAAAAAAARSGAGSLVRKSDAEEAQKARELSSRMAKAAGGFLLSMNETDLGGDGDAGGSGGGLGDLLNSAIAPRKRRNPVRVRTADGMEDEGDSEYEEQPGGDRDQDSDFRSDTDEEEDGAGKKGKKSLIKRGGAKRTLNRASKKARKDEPSLGFLDDDELAVEEAEGHTGKALLAGFSGSGVFTPDYDGLDAALVQNVQTAFLTARLGGRPVPDAVLQVLVLERPSITAQGKTLQEIVAAVTRMASKLPASSDRAQALRAVDRKVVEKFLDTAALLSDHLIDKTERRPMSGRGSPVVVYDVNRPAVMKILQARVLSSAVRARAGSHGLRVFNFLRQAAYSSDYPSGKVEDKIVAEKCLLAHKSARTTLMSLMNNGFIQGQDLSKIAAVPGAVKGQVFFVRDQEAFEKLIESIYKSLTNLKARLEFENKTVVNTIRRGGDASLLETRMIAEDILDLNICKVDEALLILNN